MTSTAKKVLDDALALSAEDRRHVAERLLESVEREPADDVERAWDEEVLRRIEAAEDGETQARDWRDASAELRAKYTRR